MRVYNYSLQCDSRTSEDLCISLIIFSDIL